MNLNFKNHIPKIFPTGLEVRFEKKIWTVFPRLGNLVFFFFANIPCIVLANFVVIFEHIVKFTRYSLNFSLSSRKNKNSRNYI